MALFVLAWGVAPTTPVRAEAPPDPAPADPPVVAAALERLADARAALRATRLGLEAELRLRPEARLLARDDPPRPLGTAFAWRPDASLVWAPLRSEVLLAEARALEAELDVVDARRDALAAWLHHPVARARAEAALAEARADLREAEDDARRAGDAADATRAALAAARAAGAHGAALEDAERAAGRAASALAAARLDRRDAELDLRDAERAAAALAASPPRPRAAPAAPPERPDLAIPDPVAPRALLAHRAREARLAADVRRAERRRVDAFVPRVGMEAGYAGSTARVEGELELDGGRPRARLGAAIVGTPQERFWATLSASIRVGTDAVEAARAPERLREEARRASDALAAELAAEAREARADARAARARWRLAEARLDAARAEGSAATIARAEDAARRDWLRFLRAAVDAAEAAEVPLIPLE